MATPSSSSSSSSSTQPVHFTGHTNFRLRLTLSLLSRKPILITSIRPNSTSPGLRDFEASFLRLIEKVTNGSKVEISYTGTAVKFLPGTLSGGSVTHDCGTSRGVGYFLEWVALLAPFCKKELSLTLKGVTTGGGEKGDMGADALRTVLLPVLAEFLPPATSLASPLELRIAKRGHFPLGGGEVFFRCPLLPNVSSAGVGAAGGGGGGMIKTIDWTEPGKVKRIRGIASASRVSPAMANRLVERARKTLNRYVPDLYIFADVYRGDDAGKSPGFSLSLLTQSTTSSFHYAESHSTPGAVPEDVATSCVSSLLCSLAAAGGGCIPRGLQPHVLALMASSPEDVARVRIGGDGTQEDGGGLSAAAVQTMRDVEAVWGLRFLVRRVEGRAPRKGRGGKAGKLGGRSDDEEDEDDDDDDDDEDDEDAESSESDEEEEEMPLRHDLILSCRGVGVRGARKAQ